MKKQFRIINTRKGILNITSADLNEVVGGGTVIVNNTLTSTSITEALSAYQGKVLKDVQDSQQVSINLNTAKVSNVVQTLSNTLDGTSNTTALSSNQGSLKLIPGTNVTFTNTGTSLNRIITINATTSGGGGGTVTRVGALNGTYISSVSSDITGAGDLRYDLSATGTPSINTYLRGDNTWTAIPSSGGGVTSVSAGGGMDFTTITGSGSVTMGTPFDITSLSVNGVAAQGHTHALNIVNSDVGDYTNASISVDNKGRITAASSGTGGGGTDLGTTRTGAAVTITSNTGSNAVINVPTSTQAGIVSNVAQAFWGVKTFNSNIISLGNSTAVDHINTSDRRRKENITDYIVKPINIKYREFNFIGIEDTMIGVIADEIEATNPEFVVKGNTPEDMDSVRMTGLMLAKIAELEDRIKQLEK